MAPPGGSSESQPFASSVLSKELLEGPRPQGDRAHCDLAAGDFRRESVTGLAAQSFQEGWVRT